jgi:hypothetical protein
MGKTLLAIATLAFCACQPMYGAKAPKPRDPQAVRHPAVPPEPPKGPRPTIDECNYKVVAAPKSVKVDRPRSEEATRRGDTAIGSYERATDAKAKSDLLIDSIQQYGNALEKDPYNPEATLKLARAYDVAARKGCALRLLGRIAKLADNPLFEKKANLVLDDLDNHKSWFEDYRREAMAAAGR